MRQLPQEGSEDLTLEKANEAVLTVKKRFWALKKGLWGHLEVYQECCKIDQHGKLSRHLMRKAFVLVVGAKFTVEAIDRLVCIAIPDEAGSLTSQALKRWFGPTAFDLAQEWKAAEKTEESSRWRQSQGWWQDGSWSRERQDWSNFSDWGASYSPSINRWCGQAVEAEEHVQPLVDEAADMEEIHKAVQEQSQQQQARLKRHVEAVEDATSKVRLVKSKWKDRHDQEDMTASSLQSQLSQLCSQKQELEATSARLSQEMVEPTCIGCLSALANQIFLPCGHIHFCLTCAIRHVQNPDAMCPTCRCPKIFRRTARPAAIVTPDALHSQRSTIQ